MYILYRRGDETNLCHLYDFAGILTQHPLTTKSSMRLRKGLDCPFIYNIRLRLLTQKYITLTSEYIKSKSNKRNAIK